MQKDRDSTTYEVLTEDDGVSTSRPQVLTGGDDDATIGSRLQQARAALGKSQREMAAASHIPIDSYIKYENDSRGPGVTALTGLAEAGVDLRWLLTGKGGGPLLKEDRAAYEGAFALLPLYDIRTPAGRQRLINRETPAEYRAYSRPWLNAHVRVLEERLALINVPGDSLEPDLHDGEEVMIDCGDVDELREGSYVFCLGDGMFTKRLSLRPSGLFMGRAIDPAEHALVDLQRDETFKVIGRFIGQPMFRRL